MLCSNLSTQKNVESHEWVSLFCVVFVLILFSASSGLQGPPALDEEEEEEECCSNHSNRLWVLSPQDIKKTCTQVSHTPPFQLLGPLTPVTAILPFSFLHFDLPCDKKEWFEQKTTIKRDEGGVTILPLAGFSCSFDNLKVLAELVFAVDVVSCSQRGSDSCSNRGY